ncbi:flagellar hook-basal body complex protein FliE [Candidatus Nitrospira salsa]
MEDFSIRGFDPILESIAKDALRGPTQANGASFGELLKSAVESVNQLQHQSDRLEGAVARGEDVAIHDAIIAGEKAGLSFRLMMTMRNKLLEAYQEVLRMQV